MSEKKIVIANEAYGDAYSCHIRDPKVWKEEGNYYMVLGARDKEDHGLILLYQSENLEQWNFVKEIRSEKPFGYMWECPDCFTLEGQQILSFSPQGLERGREKNQNLFQAGYTKVNGNILHEYTLDHFHEWDMGFDFYAQQTFLDESGRRLLIGWMGLPDVQLEYQNPSVACGWQHCLTMVREVKIEDGVIKTPPVEEYGQLRTVHKEITSEHSCETSTCAEIVVSNPTLRDVELTINKDIQLVWLSNTEQFVLQFTGDSGCGRDKRIVRITKLSKIQIYLDHSAMEIYLNDGEAVLSSRFYLQSQNVSISCLSEDVNLDIWELSI